MLLFFFLTFDDDCVISISHEGKLVASVGSTCVADALAVSACECLGKPIFLERKNEHSSAILQANTHVCKQPGSLNAMQGQGDKAAAGPLQKRAM